MLFRVQHDISAHMRLCTYNRPKCAPYNTAAPWSRKLPNMGKHVYSLSSAQEPECYSSIILGPFDSGKITLIGKWDLSEIDRNLEWRFEIPNYRGQCPMVIILPAMAETVLAIQPSRGDKQWVEGHPHNPLLACLVLFIEYHEDRCCGAWNILFAETSCLVTVFSSIGTLETYFCISSLIDVCLFSVSDVDRASCVILNQRHGDEVIWIFT